MEVDDRIQRINSLVLKNIRVQRPGDIFVSIIGSNRNNSFVYNFLKIVRYTFLNRVTINKQIANSTDLPIAMLFSNDYASRTDHRKQFDIVASLVDNKVLYMPGRRISLSNVRYLPLIISWTKTLRIVFSYRESLTYATDLFVAYLDAIFVLKSLLLLNIKHLLVFCDTVITDNLLVQLAIERGIRTVTLQHGYYQPNSTAFSCSPSDFFLCYGTSSLENAGVKSGNDKFIPVGMSQLIEKSPSDTIVNNKTKKFVVFMSNNATEEVASLRITEILVEEYGYQRIIKLHPARKRTMYNYCWKDNDCVVSDEVRVVDLFNQTDFAIIPSGSTVYIECLLELFPVFLSEHNYCYYEESSSLKFHNQDQLISLVRKLNNNPQEIEGIMKGIRSYHTLTENVRENYESFLSSFVNYN